MEILLDVLMITVPALLVLLAAVLIVRYYTKKEYDLKLLEIRLKGQDTMNPLKLQAYERMTLFMERISPHNLVPRVRQTDMTSKEMQIALLQNIREEYEHNLAQQVYISRDTWESISLVKDDLIKTINIISASLPTEASGYDLSKAILSHYMQQKEAMPMQQALDIIKAEVKTTFG